MTSIATLLVSIAGRRAFLGLAGCATLTGCLGLDPVKSTERYFVLTPVRADAGDPAKPAAPAVGVGAVKVASYLFNMSFAVRNGTNEIEYSRATQWAERLDTGIQRILAANLAALVPTDRVRLSAWRGDEVAAEVYVNIEQFDVNTDGQAVLVAGWRVVSPGGERTFKATSTRLSRQGPAPAADPGGAIATLSELLGELSREIVPTLRTTPGESQSAPAAK